MRSAADAVNSSALPRLHTGSQWVILDRAFSRRVLARLGRIREANALKDKCQEENANPFSCYSAASAADTSPQSRRNRERFAFATACYAPDGDVEIRGMPDFEADDDP